MPRGVDAFEVSATTVSLMLLEEHLQRRSRRNGTTSFLWRVGEELRIYNKVLQAK